MVKIVDKINPIFNFDYNYSHAYTFLNIKWSFPSRIFSVNVNKSTISNGFHVLKKSWTLWWRRSLSYRSQSIDLQSKSMDCFLYDRDLFHEILNGKLHLFCTVLLVILTIINNYIWKKILKFASKKNFLWNTRRQA